MSPPSWTSAFYSNSRQRSTSTAFAARLEPWLGDCFLQPRPAMARCGPPYHGAQLSLVCASRSKASRPLVTHGSASLQKLIPWCTRKQLKLAFSTSWPKIQAVATSCRYAEWP